MSYGRDFLGPYRLIRLVRAGNSCQIWDCVREGDEKRVALKVLQKEHRKNREEINFLKHEFEVGKGLSHERVIEIYDLNFEYDLPFLVLQFYSGKNVKQLMRTDPELIEKHTTSMIEQCATGLHYLHEQGWIHRDVKPDNFLLDDSGNIKLIDFALAHKITTGLASFFAGRAKVQGTRSYMSPEQIRGKNLDRRSDVYSLGCMIFELLSSRLPYTGVSENDLLNKHIRAGIPNVAALNNRVTPEMAALVMQMMTKDPEGRPRSMLKFLQDFRSIRVFKAGK
ncbi:serine/threonine-protein kinase [Lignipirellula cremea]|uniref:mitogen-activated protein kinase kinase n=1 Tax=Lignipirellula cremea TaxID=2528010 RepID=A0A518E2K9_9BACT|nr:serine/threonine-protein kinase [Lignipirellula cremea]QDU98326.1 Serine/threonine-protein kinase PrkC [Lignipirellula cremea]